MGSIKSQEPLKVKNLSQLVVRGRHDHGRKVKERWNSADFEDGGRGPQTKECRRPLETEKSKKTIFSPGLLEENAALLTP